jgi:hypothetical protein
MAVNLDDLSEKDREKLLAELREQRAEEQGADLFRCPGVLNGDGSREPCGFTAENMHVECPDHGVLVA